MEWNNLKLNKCPKCGEDLSSKGYYSGKDWYFQCICGFRISEKRMKEIVQSKISQQIEEKHYRPEDEVPDELPSRKFRR